MDMLEGDALGRAFATALNGAMFAAFERLTEIITQADPEDAVAACDTLFGFALAIGASPED